MLMLKAKVVEINEGVAKIRFSAEFVSYKVELSNVIQIDEKYLGYKLLNGLLKVDDEKYIPAMQVVGGSLSKKNSGVTEIGMTFETSQDYNSIKRIIIVDLSAKSKKEIKKSKDSKNKISEGENEIQY